MVYPTGAIEKTAVINFKTFDNNENKKAISTLFMVLAFKKDGKIMFFL